MLCQPMYACKMCCLVGWLVGCGRQDKKYNYTITVGSLAGLGNEAILTQQCGK